MSAPRIRRIVEKYGRGRMRWYWSVEWTRIPEGCSGFGGWTHTKTQAKRMAAFTAKTYDPILGKDEVQT